MALFHSKTRCHMTNIYVSFVFLMVNLFHQITRTVCKLYCHTFMDCFAFLSIFVIILACFLRNRVQLISIKMFFEVYKVAFLQWNKLSLSFCFPKIFLELFFQLFYIFTLKYQYTVQVILKYQKYINLL